MSNAFGIPRVAGRTWQRSRLSGNRRRDGSVRPTTAKHRQQYDDSSTTAAVRRQQYDGSSTTAAAMDNTGGGDDHGCAVCGEPAAQRCANCMATRYCGKAHQRAHWTRGGHRAACRPYAVAASPTLGRYMVAARDIAAGEVLLEERPLAAGPKAGQTAAVCLTCCAPDPPNRCDACGWPACGARCATAPVHRLAECPLIRGHYRPGRAAAYCFVLPLRCMLLRDDDDDGRAFRSLQTHLDSRRDTPLYRAYAVNVAAYVLDGLGLRSAGGGHDELSALSAVAALDTNAFDVRRPGGRCMRAVYASASMMSHDCTPNTKHVFVGDGPSDPRPAIRIVAAVPIERGAAVTATYTQTLWSTRDRRQHLLNAKCFECACARCADPAELGTHLGSAACATPGCGGLAVPNDDGGGGGWLCADCGRRTAVDGVVLDARRLVRPLLDQPDCGGFERFLDRVRDGTVPPLHADHHVAVAVKYALAQLYGDRIPDLSAKQLENNTKICEELLSLADVLEPGITRFRGLLMFYLVCGLKQLKRIKKNADHDGMIENYTGQAAVILKTEPDLEHLLDRLQ